MNDTQQKKGSHISLCCLRLQASEASQGDFGMLSQSSQDQTQAMDEGTPPEKNMSTGRRNSQSRRTPCRSSSLAQHMCQKQALPCMLA